jgi:hypothetical protein
MAVTDEELFGLVAEGSTDLEPLGPTLADLVDVSLDSGINFEGDVWLIVDFRSKEAVLVCALDTDEDDNWIGPVNAFMRRSIPDHIVAAARLGMM